VECYGKVPASIVLRMFLTIGRPGVSEDSSIPSAVDNPVIRKALLRDFYGKFEKQFDEIWKLLNRGTIKSLAGELAKDDVAIRLSEIVALNQRRYDPAAFREHQSKRFASDSRVPVEGSYFDVVKRGIRAAEAAAENLEVLVASFQAFDHLHIDKTFEALNGLSVVLGMSSPEMDFSNFLKSALVTGRDIKLLAAAMQVATGQSLHKQGRGRPGSIYVSLAIELAILWDELTRSVIVTPKSSRQDKTGLRPGSPQPSTQFIWLAMQMVDPKVTLQKTETAIRNAMPAVWILSEHTPLAKRITIDDRAEAEFPELMALLKGKPVQKKG
jgi:hypothetical protein